MFVFFFFKQKTAYEMRISDWSSDVCSSDLRIDFEGADANARYGPPQRASPQGAQPCRQLGQVERFAEIVIGPAIQTLDPIFDEIARGQQENGDGHEIGRASCRERVCQYV